MATQVGSSSLKATGMDTNLGPRIALIVAGVALLASLTLGFLPTRGRAIVSFQPPGLEIAGDVNCGSVFSSTKWTHADGCEGPIGGRGGLMIATFVVAVVFGAVGLVLVARRS